MQIFKLIATYVMYHPEKEIFCLFYRGKKKKSSHKYDSADMNCCRQYDTKQDDSCSDSGMKQKTYHNKVTSSILFKCQCFA